MTCADPTRITRGPVSQTVDVGDEVLLHCEAETDQSERLTVQWTRDGLPINFDRLSHVRLDYNNSLIISSAAVTDTGKYSCQAGNGLDEVESAPATVTVRGLFSPSLFDNMYCVLEALLLMSR